MSDLFHCLTSRTCEEIMWIEPVLTSLSILVGAGIIIWQQRAANQAELKLKLFEELRIGLNGASTAVTTVGMFAMTAPLHIDAFQKQRGAGLSPGVPTMRVAKLMELHEKAVRQTLELTVLIEAHEIVSEHFELFRHALVCAMRDVGDAYAELLPITFFAYPADLPAAADPFVPVLTPTQFAKLKKHSDMYWEAMSEIGCYVHDIQVEAQNVLLGGMFSRRVPSRKPTDPLYRVLRTDDAETTKELRKYFMEDHPAAALARANSSSVATATTD